jgi:hypothetical protein
MFDERVFNLDDNEEIYFRFMDNFLMSEDFVWHLLIRFQFTNNNEDVNIASFQTTMFNAICNDLHIVFLGFSFTEE